MVCVGAIIAGSAIVPLSFDDENYSKEACSIACMATPWLISIGFVTAFSALFSKIWRVNKIFRNPHSFKRIKVTEKDVLAPFFFLMTVNIITLICWTTINPLIYEREPSSGTDYWNREYKSFHGSCVSSTDSAGGAVPFIVLLVVINGVAVIIANVQAYQARHINVEFQESKYIAMATACMLESFIIGVPVVALLKENPTSVFIVVSLLIFITCTAVLGLLFIPKVVYLREYDADQTEKKSSPSRQCERSASAQDGGMKFDIMEVRKRIGNKASYINSGYESEALAHSTCPRDSTAGPQDEGNRGGSGLDTSWGDREKSEGVPKSTTDSPQDDGNRDSGLTMESPQEDSNRSLAE